MIWLSGNGLCCPYNSQLLQVFGCMCQVVCNCLWGPLSTTKEIKKLLKDNSEHQRSWLPQLSTSWSPLYYVSWFSGWREREMLTQFLKGLWLWNNVTEPWQTMTAFLAKQPVNRNKRNNLWVQKQNPRLPSQQVWPPTPQRLQSTLPLLQVCQRDRASPTEMAGENEDHSLFLFSQTGRRFLSSCQEQKYTTNETAPGSRPGGPF